MLFEESERRANLKWGLEDESEVRGRLTWRSAFAQTSKRESASREQSSDVEDGEERTASPKLDVGRSKGMLDGTELRGGHGMRSRAEGEAAAKNLHSPAHRDVTLPQLIHCRCRLSCSVAAWRPRAAKLGKPNTSHVFSNRHDAASRKTACPKVSRRWATTEARFFLFVRREMRWIRQ